MSSAIPLMQFRYAVTAILTGRVLQAYSAFTVPMKKIDIMAGAKVWKTPERRPSWIASLPDASPPAVETRAVHTRVLSYLLACSFPYNNAPRPGGIETAIDAVAGIPQSSIIALDTGRATELSCSA